MTPSTAVLLIPGFFGFASFGPDEHPILEYFAGVRSVLEPLLPDHFVVTHEPPPTGSLDSRVARLHDAIGKLLRGDLLPHGRRPFKAERIHLVGHSTGGVDARLFANPAFTWDGGPTGSARTAPIEALGNVVTLSSPLHGTPLATNIAAYDTLLLEAVRVLTMLGVFTNGDAVRIGIEILKASPAAIAEHPLVSLKALVAGPSARQFLSALSPLLVRKEVAAPRAPALLIDAAGKGRPPSAGAQVAAQVGAFFHSVETDGALLGDLTVESMAGRVARIPNFGATDHGSSGTGRLVSYVTVAPPPPRVDLLALRHFEFVQSYVYATLYRATRGALTQQVPAGPSLGPSSRTLLEDPGASDGVVPVRSQTLTGIAAGIVLADHLDVVGSFDGGSGANVMRSGANFSGERFEALWRDIAQWLA